MKYFNTQSKIKTLEICLFSLIVINAIFSGYIAYQLTQNENVICYWNNGTTKAHVNNTSTTK